MTDGEPSGRGCSGCFWSACVAYVGVLLFAAGADWLYDQYVWTPGSLKGFFTLVLSLPLGLAVSDPIADALSPGWITLPIYVSLIAGLLQVVLFMTLVAGLTWLVQVVRSGSNRRSETRPEA